MCLFLFSSKTVSEKYSADVCVICVVIWFLKHSRVSLFTLLAIEVYKICPLKEQSVVFLHLKSWVHFIDL